MRKILNEQEVEQFIKNKNGELLEIKIINGFRKALIKCNICGHKWNKKIGELYNNKWCLGCNKKKREINREKTLSLIESKGYELLYDKEITRETIFDVRCPIHDFVWKSRYANFKYRNNSGKCPLCRCGTPSIKTVNDFIINLNGTLIKKELIKTNLWYFIRCNVHPNHVWKTMWKSLYRRGSWCSLCSWEKQTISHNKIKEIVEKKNGTLLDNDCVGSQSSFKIKCNKDGHVWSSTWPKLRGGHWCPKCANLIRYTYDVAKEIINKRGGILLTEDINGTIPVRKMITIKCKCNNIFSVLFGNIVSHDNWCQICGNKQGKSKTQKKLFSIVKELYPNFKIEYNYRRFSWLKMTLNSKSKLEIDILVHKDGDPFSLAIEYDGKQHFKPARFVKTMTTEQAEKAFKSTKKRDKKKDQLIAQHPDEVKYFIRFNYKEPITKEYVLEKLKENNIPIPS